MSFILNSGGIYGLLESLYMKFEFRERLNKQAKKNEF